MTSPRSRSAPHGVVLFFLLACAITWLLDLPLTVAYLRHVAPTPLPLLLVGLGAWGPTLAAWLVAARDGTVGEVFGRWRTNPGWVLVGLLVLPALHLPATLLERALGGQPAHWFYPPPDPARFAALVMFPLGEELGWRGLAYPRLARSYGPVRGGLVVGAVWGLWHLLMMVTPDGSFDLLRAGITMIDLPLYSVVFAWVLRRANGSLAVAIALHAGAHLDNVYDAPATELRLRVLRFLVLAAAAGVTARALRERRVEPVADSGAAPTG